MEPTKTANHSTKINNSGVPPPPGMMSPIRNSVGVSQSPGRPSSEQQQQIHSYLSSPLHTNSSTLFVSSPGNNGSVGGGSPGMLRRRAATEDNTQLFLHSNNDSNQQQLTQHQRSTSTNELPWTNIQSNTNIFRSDKGLGSPGNPARRVSQEEQRNESTHRLRSDLLDPMLLSPTTNHNSIDDEDNDEHRLGSPRQQHTPRQQQSNDIFRNNNRGYSPIIGTPTRASGGRKPMYNITSSQGGASQVGGLRNNLSLSSNSDNDSVTSGGGHWSSNNSQASGGGFATTIRPSLSCPTSVFESPLFPSNTNSNIAGSNVHPLTRLGSRGSSLGRSANHLQLSGGTNTLLLSQPYRLEKITSGSVEPSPINNSDGNANQYEFEDEDDLLVDNVKSQDVFDTESSPIKSPSENSSTNNERHRLNLDVSVIEVEDDDSPHRRPIADNNKGTQDRQLKQSPNTGGSQHSMASQINNMTASQHANNTAGTKNNTSRPSTAGNESNTTQATMLDVDGNPMRNLSDAFELLVVDGQQQPLHSQHVYAQQQQQQRGGAIPHVHQNGTNDTSMLTNNNDVTKNNSGETSATKPSPTSVSDFGGETTSSSSLTTNSTNNNNVSTTKKKTHQLANGLTVASISMPHFHLHDTLRGTLNQGLIDRASFYSVLRDINKEALDATLTDPKGHLYNDGSVHEKNKVGKKNKKQQQGQVGGQSSDANNDTTTAENNVSGKKKKERPTPIVIAEDGKVHVHPNPKEEQKSILVMACVTDENNETVSEQQLASLREKPVSLGAALLDEEWWLMSAIASRTPNEVAMNQSTNLLPTFFEAMGEKDANSVADSTGVYSTGATSRTQLWKPGRSWWEAKSGKNPWVEPVVHNNRWR